MYCTTVLGYATLDLKYTRDGSSCSRAKGYVTLIMTDELQPYNPAEGNNPYFEVDLKSAYEQSLTGGKSIEERNDIKYQFLNMLIKGASVSKALNIINNNEFYIVGDKGRISRKTIYSWRKYEPDFAKAWDEAYAIGTDRIEDRAYDVANEGNPALLKYLLAIRNPKRYASPVRAEVTGANGGPVQVDRIEIVPVAAGAAVTGELIELDEDEDRPDPAT